jgi:DNA polymerase-3 subunit delta'
MDKFNDILGKINIRRNLQYSIKNNRVVNSYIFNGEEGLLKEETALVFAKTLLCEKNSEEPCGKCASCKTFSENNNPDFIKINEEGSSLKVEEIREKLVSDVEIKPYSSKYKIYYINRADLMTVGAQNAILKTLEEPPKYVIILLIANDKRNFLETILSRCVTYDFKELTNDEISTYIENNYTLDSYDKEVAVGYARGYISKLDNFLGSSDEKNKRSLVQDIIERLDKEDFMSIFDIAKELENNKENIDDLLDIFISYYRDMIIVKSEIDDKYIINKDKKIFIRMLAKNVEMSEIFNNCDIIERTKRFINSNTNFKLTIENMLMELKGEKVW